MLTLLVEPGKGESKMLPWLGKWRGWPPAATVSGLLCTAALMLALVICLLAPGTLRVRASLRSSAHLLTRPLSAQNEGAWFQLSHFGKQPPAPEARLAALQQAAQLPPDGSTSTWTPLGPEPIESGTSWGALSGRVTAIAVNPRNPNGLWIGAADGGAWRSSDGGQHWIPMTDKQGTLSTGAIAIDPNNPNIIYVGTGEPNHNGDAYWGIGLLKTTNAGKTWNQSGFRDFAGLSIGKIAIDPANSQILLLAATYGSQTPIPGGPGSLYNNTGIWRSSDGGLSWTQVLADPDQPGPDAGTDVLFDPANPQVAFAGLGNVLAGNATIASGVYESTDSGQTWTQLTNGLPTGSDVERVSLGISQDGSHVYAVITDGDYRDYPKEPYFGDLLDKAIFVSSDGGATWTARKVSTIPGMVNDDGTRQWWYDSLAAVDPSVSAGTTAYVGGTDLWQTTDGGQTWTNLTNATNNGPVYPAQHALAFLSPTASTYYLAGDGGVWKGTSNGTFTNLNSGGLDITQFYSGSVGDVGPDATTYGGAQGGGVDQYPAGASGPGPWNGVYGGDIGQTIVDYTNNAIVYAAAAYGAVSKSTDGGQTWNPADTGINLHNPVNFVMPLVMSPTINTELFAGTDRVFRTTDSASSWFPISGSLDNGTPLSAIAVAPASDKTIYAGDDNGNVYVTTNGGMTWRGGPIPHSTGTMVTSLAVDQTNAGTVYATFAGFAPGRGAHVFRSTDAGATWTDISLMLPNIPVTSILVNSGSGALLVGSDAGVFDSLNGGTTWQRLGTGLPNVAIDQLFTNRSGTQLFVATHGRGMWTMTEPLSVYGSSYVGKIFALQASDGSERWTYQTGRAVRSSPALMDGVLYVGSANQNIYALDTRNGAILWQRNMGGPVASSPTVVGGSVYFGVYYPNTSVYCLDTTSGKLRWHYVTGGPILSSPAVVNGVVYIGSYDNNLYRP